MGKFNTPTTDKETYILVVNEHSFIFETRNRNNPYISDFVEMSLDNIKTKIEQLIDRNYAWVS